MANNTCPRCDTKIINVPLYQCCRCFTVYCSSCQETQDGRVCPQCKMGSRLILSSGK